MKIKKYQAISRLLRYMVYCENSENNMTDQYEIAKKHLENMVDKGGFIGFSIDFTDKINPEKLIFSIAMKDNDYTVIVRPSLAYGYLLTVKGKHTGKTHVESLLDRFLSEIVDYNNL